MSLPRYLNAYEVAERLSIGYDAALKLMRRAGATKINSSVRVCEETLANYLEQQCQPKRGPYMYRRKGRLSWYAFLDRDHKDISLGTENDQEAEKAFAALLERSRIRELAPREKGLAELFAQCRARAETRHTVKTTYELHLNLKRILEWCEERGVIGTHRITQTLIEDYETARKFSVSAGRINRELDSWKKAMKLGVELRCAPSEVLGWFTKLREPRPEPNQRGLSRKELEAFFKAEKNPGYRAFFRVTLGSAMRDEEVRHMELTDVRPRAIVVTPKPPGTCECCPDGWSTKSFRYRTIPASTETVKAAKTFLSLKGTINLDKKAVWKRIQNHRGRREDRLAVQPPRLPPRLGQPHARRRPQNRRHQPLARPRGHHDHDALPARHRRRDAQAGARCLGDPSTQTAGMTAHFS